MNKYFRSLFYAAAGIIVLATTACKPRTDSGEMSLAVKISPTPTATPRQKGQQVQQEETLMPYRQLTAVEWFTKKNISVEEEKTVDAIIEILRKDEGRTESPENLARWAERNLQILMLEGQKLSNISPLLALRNLSTLSIIGNSFRQSQVDELVRGLPKLRNLVTDPGVSCRANLKVNCLQ